MSPQMGMRTTDTSTEDAAALERLRLGDNSAMGEILARHAGAVHRITRSILADSQVAEEAAQDVFIELWKRPERVDPSRGSLRSYLVGMGRNKAIDRLRSHYARQRMVQAVLKEAEASAGELEGSEE